MNLDHLSSQGLQPCVLLWILSPNVGGLLSLCHSLGPDQVILSFFTGLSYDGLVLFPRECLKCFPYCALPW